MCVPDAKEVERSSDVIQKARNIAEKYDLTIGETKGSYPLLIIELKRRT